MRAWVRNSTMNKKGLLAFLLALAFGSSASAGELNLAGKWSTRVGVIRIFQQGKSLSGKLIWVNDTCSFKKGDVILEGVLLEDSLAGRWRYCLRGKDCRGDGWAPMVMLAAREGKVLSGAAHFPETACAIGGRGKGDAVAARKLKPVPVAKIPVAAPDAGAPAVAGPVDEKGRPLEEQVPPPRPEDYAANSGSWRSEMEQGASQMDSGFFERARKNFLHAIELDPTRPEAYNGVGVTYYARNDYEEALNWYKKALEVDSSFGDAFYNMACVYALLGKKQLALRFLGIAAINGYAEAEAMQKDPDLEKLRSEPEYKKILEQMSNKK